MTLKHFTHAVTGKTIRSFDGRRTMRGLADALDKLQELGALTGDGSVLMGVARWELPDGRTPGLVSVTPAGSGAGAQCSILMPYCSEFRATTTFGKRRTFTIDDLDQAASDTDGNVQLRDGTYVHAVELVPESLVYTLGKEQEDILCAVIRVLGAEDRCFRPLHETLLPGLIVLDYARVAELGREPLPSLKAIHREVLMEMPDVSRQMLANVLAIAGLRRPRSGPRARA